MGVKDLTVVLYAVWKSPNAFYPCSDHISVVLCMYSCKILGGSFLAKGPLCERVCLLYMFVVTVPIVSKFKVIYCCLLHS